MAGERHLAPLEESIVNLSFDAMLVNRRLFQRYFMPEWEKCARALHEHEKLLGVHCDGLVAALKDLVPQTDVDIIKPLHPPPMGDLPIGQALSLWKDRVIWMDLPGSVYALGSEATKKHTLALLREVVPGDRLTIEVSTEDLVSDENLRVLTSVLDNAELPLTEEKIDKMERTLV